MYVALDGLGGIRIHVRTLDELSQGQKSSDSLAVEAGASSIEPQGTGAASMRLQK